MGGAYAPEEKAPSHNKLEDNHVLPLLGPGGVLRWSWI